ncbi:MAG: hypothetical protein Q9220_006181 [cf. Caloplaca sp. 1 TL-2023]
MGHPSFLATSSTVDPIEPPAGFSCVIEASGGSRALDSKGLYSVALHSLLHFSLLDYFAPAEVYSTHGPQPSGPILANVVPIYQPPEFRALNSHIAWGVYRSVIAFNYPPNLRETKATVSVLSHPNAEIGYLQTSQAPAAIQRRPGNETWDLSSASALQMLHVLDHDLSKRVTPSPNPNGFSLRFFLRQHGREIRRETAYDTVAYAILWTARFAEDTKFTGQRTIAVPGGRVYVRFQSYQIRQWDPMTLGFAATVARTLPQILEEYGRFQEAFFQVNTPDGDACGTIGIYTLAPRASRSSRP